MKPVDDVSQKLLFLAGLDWEHSWVRPISRQHFELFLLHLSSCETIDPWSRYKVSSEAESTLVLD